MDAMWYRCTNEKHKQWKDYGGRGISICKKWETFSAFLEDLGEHPEGTTLDRIDNNGNYEPSNCRWASPKDQMMNRRITKGTRAVSHREAV